MSSERVSTVLRMGEQMLTVIKEFEYRGATEEWSNSYHFDGITTDPAGFRTAADALIALEKEVYSPRVTITRVLCYHDDASPSDYTYILADFGGNVAGVLSATAGVVTPGDTAGWVRWDTGLRSSSGKPIYLRKYFHDCMTTTPPDEDLICSAQRTAYQDFGDALLAAIAGPIQMVDPHGNVPSGAAKGGTYATTRTLKRRGPRP